MVRNLKLAVAGDEEELQFLLILFYLCVQLLQNIDF